MEWQKREQESEAARLKEELKAKDQVLKSTRRAENDAEALRAMMDSWAAEARGGGLTPVDMPRPGRQRIPRTGFSPPVILDVGR